MKITPCVFCVIAVDCKLDPSAEVSIYRSDSGSDSLSSTGSRKTVSRADSVNDHGYFTLEKRKPVQQLMDSPRSGRDGAVDVPDDMDLRHNFEEFHLDSLEEEEHFYELGKDHILVRGAPGHTLKINEANILLLFNQVHQLFIHQFFHD